MSTPRRGFVMIAALIVVLLFAVATLLGFAIVHEGNGRIYRRRAEREAHNLAESMIAGLRHQVRTTGSRADLPPLELGRGVGTGTIAVVGLDRFELKGEGRVEVLGGGEARVKILVTALVQEGSFRQLQWRYASLADD